MGEVELTADALLCSVDRDREHTMKVGCAVLVVFVAMGGVLLAGGCDGDRDKYMNREAAALRERTVPPDAGAIYESGITRSASSATTYWEFDVTPPAWADYRDWAKTKMTPAYTLVPSKDGELAIQFTKSLEGDAHHVRTEPLTEGNSLRVRVTFQSYAN